MTGLKRNILGRTGIEVSSLCFGTLTLGPLQAGLSLKKGAELIRYALEQGVNFFDTADLYDTYPYLKEGLKGREDETVVASKSYDYTRKGMVGSLEKARREMNRDCIDIFMLHEQESHLTIKGHMEALNYLQEAKEKGLVRAVGLSTHHVAAVQAASEMEGIDIIHPIVNVKGIGIQDGSREDMERALAEAARKGTGLVAMKPLGGGHLMGNAREAFRYILQLPWLASTAVGMQCKSEVDANCHYFSSTLPPQSLQDSLNARKRRLLVHPWCQGCGRCLAGCRQKALCLEGGKVRVQEDLCVLCGYCGSSCPLFCLKIV